jgi:ribosomal protein S18 acetylase RimI-like enzyme
MYKNNEVPLIEYMSPGVWGWNNFRQVITGNFPDLSEGNVSHLIRNGMNNIIIARCEKKIAGFCYFEEISCDKLHLLYLAAEKDFHRRGVASQILKRLHCCAINRGYKVIVLTVDKDNSGAKILYEKMGYFRTKDRKAENKESWRKVLDYKCTTGVIRPGFWAMNYFPLRVTKKTLYSYLTH